MSSAVVAIVDGVALSVNDIDERETSLRSSKLAAALPRPGTSEGRQLRRWLTQQLVAERVLAGAVMTLGVAAEDAPDEDTLLPDTVARLDIGSIAAAVLADPLARAVFACVTADVVVAEGEVAAYHARNPARFAAGSAVTNGWRVRAAAAVPLEQVRAAISAHLLATAQRRAFRIWLDARCAELVELASGYEHPGDPRQPDNTHRH